MDTQPMFAIEEFEIDTPRLLEETGGVEDVVSRDDQTDGHAHIKEEQPEDRAETPLEPEQASSAPEEGPVRADEQAGGGEADPVYESTGLNGPFERDELLLVFPDFPREDFDTFVANVRAYGLLDEITVAGDPPRVIDGKERERGLPRGRGPTPVPAPEPRH